MTLRPTTKTAETLGVMPDDDDLSFYICSEEEKVGESSLHACVTTALFEMLRHHLPQTTFVTHDMFWYDRQANDRCVAADIMVVPGIGREHRTSYQSWRAGMAQPTMVLEVLSQHNWRTDVENKLAYYAERGVPEYYIYDPEGWWVTPRLQAYRLVNGRYVERTERNELGGFFSDALQLTLLESPEYLRLFRLDGTELLSGYEQAALEQRLREQAEAQAIQEAQRAEQERQLREQEQQRADQEQQRVEQERRLREHEQQLREHEQQRADQAQQRAEEAMAENERLRALLAALQPRDAEE